MDVTATTLRKYDFEEEPDNEECFDEHIALASLDNVSAKFVRRRNGVLKIGRVNGCATSYTRTEKERTARRPSCYVVRGWRIQRRPYLSCEAT